ncbi:MAG: hypothetical protein JWM10_4904, partial [Myxococcaceae bacterium]|nr:hypothetical protein [Myxococcaceae bacterium]
GAQHPLWRQVLSVSFVDDVLPSQLAEVFVINFAWVLSIFVALSAVAPLWRLLVRAPHPPDDSAEARARAFVTVAFVVTVLAVTRFRTLVIPRYVLPAAVLLPLMAQRSLHLLKVTPRLRLLLLGASAGLALFSNFRTRDALAMGLFGTFEWGDHRLLDLASRAGDLNARREHLVYNLEFTRLSALLDEAVPLALADGHHELALHTIAGWHPVGFVDDRTHRRVATARGAHEPRVWHLNEVRAASPRPPRLYHLELPGMDDDDELIVWQQYYRVGAPRRFVRDGYTLSMRELTLRADAPGALPSP